MLQPHSRNRRQRSSSHKLHSTLLISIGKGITAVPFSISPNRNSCYVSIILVLHGMNNSGGVFKTHFHSSLTWMLTSHDNTRTCLSSETPFFHASNYRQACPPACLLTTHSLHRHPAGICHIRSHQIGKSKDRMRVCILSSIATDTLRHVDTTRN